MDHLDGTVINSSLNLHCWLQFQLWGPQAALSTLNHCDFSIQLA